MNFIELPEHVKRILFVGMIVVGVIALIGVGMTSLGGLLHPPTQSVAPPLVKTNGISPLLFGTNLDLSANKQQALPSTQISNLLQSVHVQIVRFSVPEKPSQELLLRMAQYVKSINAVPLVSLHGSLYPQALTDNIQVIQTMNRVFDKTTIYYEYGDEGRAL